MRQRQPQTKVGEHSPVYARHLRWYLDIDPVLRQAERVRRREQAWIRQLMMGSVSNLPLSPYAPSSKKVKAFHKATKQIRAIFGGNGSGKTEAGAYEVIRYAATHPGAEIWCCGVTYEAIGEYIWPKFKKYLPSPMINACKIAWVSSAKEIPSVITIPMWGNVKIRFKSYEQGRRKFQGSAVDLIWLDEEPAKDIYDECLARVARTGGQIILTMTPLMGLTWAYHEIEEAPETHPYVWKTRIATGENRYLPEDAINFMMERYGADEALRRIAGEFCQPEGALWTEWKVERNVIDPIPIPRDAPRLMGIDFGFTAPLAATWMVQASNSNSNSNPDNYYLVEEYQKSGLLFEDHIQYLKTTPQYAEHLNATEVILADPEDAEKRAKLRRLFPQKRVKAANNAFQLGIDAVNRALKSTASSPPRLQVFKTCRQTIFSAAAYKIKASTMKAENEHSHLPDTIRYQVMDVMRNERILPSWTAAGNPRVFKSAKTLGW